jgi:glycosyltransferase involved in cell wall biosynthesis
LDPQKRSSPCYGFEKMTRLLHSLPTPITRKTGWPWTIETDPEVYGSRPDWPRLTIVTPSYNQGEFIEETIRSVLLQNYPDLEYFIMDGGSSDATVEIIKKYAPWITYWVSEKDGGQGNAINTGFSQATGDILAWLNSDDTYYANALRNIMTEVIQSPNHVAYVGSCDKVDPAGLILATVIPRNLNAADIADWSRSGFFYQPSCFFRRSTFEECGGMNESYQNALDIDLWMKLIARGTFKRVDATVAHAKIHPDMKTLKHVPLRDAETAAVAIAHGYPQAAVNRITSYARYYAMNQASERFLLKALSRRLWSRFKGLFS